MGALREEFLLLQACHTMIQSALFYPPLLLAQSKTGLSTNQSSLSPDFLPPLLEKKSKLFGTHNCGKKVLAFQLSGSAKTRIRCVLYEWQLEECFRESFWEKDTGKKQKSKVFFRLCKENRNSARSRIGRRNLFFNLFSFGFIRQQAIG